MNLESIQNSFHSVGLRHEITDKPLNRFTRNRDIVMMDISHRPTPTENGRNEEYFRLYPGNMDNNRIQVLDHDYKGQRLLLLIQEMKRKFEERVHKSNTHYGPRGKLIRETFDSWIYERETSGDKMFYLLGLDETHYFISEINDRRTNKGIKNIKDAERSLRPVFLTEDTIRQGEWYFIDLPFEVSEQVERDNNLNRGIYKNKFPINWMFRRRTGNAHTVDHIVEFHTKNVNIDDGIRADTHRKVYIKGRVRHPQHETLVFNNWVRVIPNRESTNAMTNSGWYD